MNAHDQTVRHTALLEAITAVSHGFITSEVLPHLHMTQHEAANRNSATLAAIERIRECDPTLPAFLPSDIPTREQTEERNHDLRMARYWYNNPQ